MGNPIRLPNTPIFVMEKVPSRTSSGLSLRLRARWAKSLPTRANPNKFIPSAPSITGTISPLFSKATATPILTYFLRMILSS